MNTNFRQTISTLLIIFCLQSCGIRTIPKPYLGLGRSVSRPQMLAVFMDGTLNKSNKNSQKNTHIRTSYGLVKKDIRSLYIEGVGTRAKILGIAIGIGTKARVVRGYRFLNEYYLPGDSIMLFGFSRGANQCRILTNMIYTAGMPDLTKLSDRNKKKLISGMYRHYRLKDSTSASRKQSIQKYISAWNTRHPDDSVYTREKQVNIELLGLWETVEAFKLDRKEEIVPRSDHLNQVMNVNKALHAVAFDDNRAWTYTPMLLSTSSVEKPAGISLDSIVNEVWFNGNHRDVGGGATKFPKPEGISLDWMLDHTKKYNLFNKNPIITYTFARAHNIFDSVFLRIFHKVNRSISDYHSFMDSSYNGKLRIHRSVIDRMKRGVLSHFKHDGGRCDWYEIAPFKDCFRKEGRGLVLKDDCACIEVVD